MIMMTGRRVAGLLDLLENFDAVHVGQADVEQHEVRRLVLGQRRPGSPASASRTWYPHSSHFCRSDQRTSFSSSTIRIFSAGMQRLAYYGRCGKGRQGRGCGGLERQRWVDESLNHKGHEDHGVMFLRFYFTELRVLSI